MKYLFIDKKVERGLEKLRRSGAQGESLAKKASAVLERIRSGDIRTHVDASARCTKYGEKRIRHCRKFDLGAGYRVISIQRDSNVYIPFLGTHDECQRWLDKNSRLKKIDVRDVTILPIVNECQPISDQAVAESPHNEGCPENEFLEEFSDKDLRVVFSGLIEGLKNRND